MDKASLFAEAIASLVNAYLSAKLFRDMGNRILGDNSSDLHEVRDWLSRLREAPRHREIMNLALLVREIANRGEAERNLAREILESVARFSEASESTGFLGGFDER